MYFTKKKEGCNPPSHSSMFDVQQTLSEQHADVIVIERVVDMPPFFAIAHQVQLTQETQLM